MFKKSNKQIRKPLSSNKYNLVRNTQYVNPMNTETETETETNVHDIDKYITNITPKIAPCRRPVYTAFDPTMPTTTTRSEQLSEFVLNSGGVVIFGTCSREKMSMINDLNKFNWGHGDGITCILLPPDASLHCFVIYRSWLLKNSNSFNHVDPIFVVHNAENVYGTVGINNNGKLMEFTMKYNVSTLTTMPGKRIETRDIFHRGTFTELHIVAAFANINDYIDQMENVIHQYHNDDISQSVNDHNQIQPNIVTTDSSTPILNNLCKFIQTYMNQNSSRIYGNFRIRLSDFLKIIESTSLSYSAFIISDPILLCDHITGIHTMISQNNEYFKGHVINDDDMSMDPVNIWNQISSSAKSNIILPLNKWSMESTIDDNNTLLKLGKTHPIVLKLVFRRILYGNSYLRVPHSAEDSWSGISPVNLSEIPLYDTDIVTQILLAVCTLIEKL